MKRNKGRARGRRPALWIAAAMAVLIAGLMACMLMNASLLHVMRATVRLNDLPRAFEGVRLLYISDIDLCGLNTPDRASEAVKALAGLAPDILVLGGDFNSPTLGEILNRKSDEQTMLAGRSAFLQSLADFQTPMGRYALMSRDDLALGNMIDTLTANGFTPLNDARCRIAVGGDVLWLVGVGEDLSRVTKYAGAFKSGDCVVCVTETPDSFPRLVTAEAADSGPWTDLCLAGHTHGGQIRIFGRSILTLTEIEQQFISGWSRETGIPLLTSSGMGCEGANLRLGSQPEVWLITLTRN